MTTLLLVDKNLLLLSVVAMYMEQGCQPKISKKHLTLTKKTPKSLFLNLKIPEKTPNFTVILVTYFMMLWPRMSVICQLYFNVPWALLQELENKAVWQPEPSNL